MTPNTFTSSKFFPESAFFTITPIDFLVRSNSRAPTLLASLFHHWQHPSNNKDMTMTSDAFHIKKIIMHSNSIDCAQKKSTYLASQMNPEMEYIHQEAPFSRPKPGICITQSPNSSNSHNKLIMNEFRQRFFKMTCPRAYIIKKYQLNHPFLHRLSWLLYTLLLKYWRFYISLL